VTAALAPVTAGALFAAEPAERQAQPPSDRQPPSRRQLVHMTLPPDALPAAAWPPSQLESAQAMANPAVDQSIARLLATAVEKRSSLQVAAEEPSRPVLREPARVSRGERGWLRSVGAPPGQAFALSPLAGDELPGERAARFMTEHADAFGVAGPGVELRSERIKDRGERRYVRLEQRFEGLKIFAASVVIQLVEDGGVEFALSDLARDDAAFHAAGFETLPKVGADAARALAVTIPEFAELAKDLQATEPELMIYEPSVIGEAGSSRLVWHVEVTSRVLPIKELVFVDAQTAEIPLHFSQIMESLNRAILDCEGDPDSSCPLARFEGDPASAVDDVNKAYDFVGDTYDFYAAFGRDSVDNQGQQLVVSVRYCTTQQCPMQNGFWSPQDEAIFLGENVAKASDFVAHEYTHGVTQHESNLIYWGESGAISESLSDIFGEAVDLTDGRGDDTPVSRWYIFEDWPTIGADRYMKDPTSPPNPCWPETSCTAGQHLRQPDRRLSAYWFTDDADQRGVHANAGVGNKLAYLLADGDNFNSWTVSAMGIDVMAALFYEAQTNLLAPGSDYFDLYDHLKQAAINLSWTAAQRANLERACRAVEITYPGTLMTVTYQDFESSFPLTGWSVVDTSGVGAQWGQDPTWPANGDASAWCAADGSNAPGLGSFYLDGMNTWLIYGPFSLADVSRAWIELWLWSDTEPEDLDYFYFGVSPDGSSITGNFISGWTNGWTRELLDFNSVGGIVGDADVWVGLNFTSGPLNSAYYGTNLDDVLIRKASCVAPPTPIISAPSNGTSGASYDVTWSGASPLNTYEIQEATDSTSLRP
jgi:Zn-dependent metalloprotease